MKVESVSTPLSGLRETVARYKVQGYRLAAATCACNPDGGFDLYYHLDKDLELIHVRTGAADGETVPSLSGIYFSALLYENEIKDQFGLAFADLALDFNGKLYLDEGAEDTPMLKAGLSVLRLSKESKAAKAATPAATDETKAAAAENKGE